MTDVPTNTILLRGMPLNIEEKDVSFSSILKSSNPSWLGVRSGLKST